MRGQAHGRIVNITSIGGKVSVPHLLPYSVAKFAAVGFSEGLRAEPGPGPVAVTTVVPGLMRTGSHVNARCTGRAEQEFTWFSLAASPRVLSMEAGAAAHQIIEAMRQRRAEVILTPLGQLVARCAPVIPGLTSAVLHATQRCCLPPPASGARRNPAMRCAPPSTGGCSTASPRSAGPRPGNSTRCPSTSCRSRRLIGLPPDAGHQEQGKDPP